MDSSLTFFKEYNVVVILNNIYKFVKVVIIRQEFNLNFNTPNKFNNQLIYIIIDFIF